MKFYKYLCITALLLGVFTPPQSDAEPNNQHIARLLGWIPDTSSGCNLCNGYYFTPEFVKHNLKPGAYRDNTTHLQSTGPTILRRNGTSVLQSNVQINQPGSLIKTDKATLYRDPKTGKVTRVHLAGNVSLRQTGKLFIAKKGRVNLTNHTASFTDATYLLNTRYNPQHTQTLQPQALNTLIRLYTQTALSVFSPITAINTPLLSTLINVTRHNKQTSTPTNANNAWGTAATIQASRDGIIKLKKATYSVCPPLSPTWKISADRIIINRNTGIAKAYDSVLRIKNIPVFYLPYWRFPVDRRRRSGFLYPQYQHSKTSGFGITLPFYWNLAANYDATLNSTYFTDRGYKLDSRFNYLTQHNKGSVYFSGIPADSGFKKFKRDTLARFPAATPALDAPFIRDLRQYSDNRGFIAFKNHWSSDDDINIPKGYLKQANNDSITQAAVWNSDINLQYVTDPYFFKDFSNSYSDISGNQLINFANLNYSGLHWQYAALLQYYQTLHRIDQANLILLNQYRRLPELDSNARYPNLWHHLDVNLDMQYVYFDYSSDFTPQTFQLPIGHRLHIRPSISRPFHWASGYITPSIMLDNTDYDSQLTTTRAGIKRPDFTAIRNIPIFSLDTALFSQRHFNWDHHPYIQTLEPHLFYLYIPYENQNKYPNFDSTLQPYSFSRAFSINSFTGFDRVNNANQISLGLSSKVLDNVSLQQRLSADLSIAYYLQPPKVCTNNITYQPTVNGLVILNTPDCDNPVDTHFSPLTGDMSIALAHNLSANSNLAWNFSHQHLDNAGASITYNNDNNIASLGYSLAPTINGPTADNLGLSTKTNQIHAGSTWKISQNWRLFGYYDYNIALKRPNSYYAGIQYDTCCWIMRLVAQKTFLGIQAGSTQGRVTNLYDHAYFLQFNLKGLGSFGSGDSSALIKASMPGYHQDPFNH